VKRKEANDGLERAFHELKSVRVHPNEVNPLQSGIHCRGYLPHVKCAGACYFVTFRLVDSIPKSVIIELQAEHAEALRRVPRNDSRRRKLELDRELRRKIERYLDMGAGACFLRRSDVACLVADSLRHFHEVQYLLDDWVVMPNHVHAILWPMPGFTLSGILRSRKRRTARQANRILCRTGETFWQKESYDHWIRSDEEKSRIRNYIRMNPVKSGLCETPEAWKWSSAWPGWGE